MYLYIILLNSLLCAGKENLIKIPNFSFVPRFSQNFIDIREKERKRGARGLVTVPKTVEIMGNETSANNITSTIISTTTLSPEEQAKADEMLKLQQKITQEILNSNLKQKEMNELQVNESQYAALK